MARIAFLLSNAVSLYQLGKESAHPLELWIQFWPLECTTFLALTHCLPFAPFFQCVSLYKNPDDTYSSVIKL